MKKDTGIHWRKWKLLCEHKSQGGLGLRDLEIFNKAFMAKQMWRLIQNSDSLVGKILKSKYFPSSHVLDAKIDYNPSLIWRSFSASFELIKEGMFWQIGNGQLTNIWATTWVPIPTSV